ncbi:Sulfotransferase family protein [Micromonospora eburnea]|uniref:Sulfotransferase family protein n=2 Tax=Micromonospora eburnea TaxID=227316 RepID=A0A1C6UWQ0_9ACTN|nr:Sulfotransferase family protein [Micromonospora eburnea]
MASQDPGNALIISTGRCGSTLLSDLIAEQADTLSVRDFLISATPWAELDGDLSGAEYWAMLSRPKPELSTLYRLGLPPREVRYPAHGRWAGSLDELPWVLAVTLSSISTDPDALFDTLAARVPDFPRQPVQRHHHMFLDLLTARTNRRRWVESSGGSSYLAPDLLRAFPSARIVHLTRNWTDTAESMRRHPAFQLFQLRAECLGRGLDPFGLSPGQAVPEDLVDLLPDRLAAETLRERGRDVRRYLWLCAFMSSQAEQAFAEQPARHLLHLRYEDLVADPVGELGRLGRFLDFEDSAEWARRMADRVVAAGAHSRSRPVGTAG